MNNRRPIRSQSGYDITQKVLESTMEMIGINDRSIAQMGELEKRLLIVLTLQYQMAKSMAMGDFARTIEQPANQLRVLQQQLSEVGRWISAVFYGTIAQVLPYINGFVMAIKELIKTFALFLGYELPDSSGDTGTIIDSMGDSMGDFGSSIDDANSGLDDTKKKAKEAAKAVGSLPFDELHTISKPSDSSGSDSVAGGGGMVDPRILDALNKWDYAFGNIRMKAMDIRDTILEWASTLGRVVDDNIFQPIQNSWDKYGSSIISNVQDTFSNIAHIAGGIFDVVGEKWKPFFQQASDLFFSLLDTASEVMNGISSFFVYVWDVGGKTLFEGIADLATAFLKLSTKINDDFVKPLISWFNDWIVPIIGSAVGAISGVFGGLLKIFASLISAISDCTPLVIGLASAFTGVFIAIKIAKFVELVDAMMGSHKIFKALIDILYDHNSLFKKVIDKWIEGTEKISNFKDMYSTLNSVLMNTSAWKTIQSVLNNVGGKMMDLGDNMIELGSSASAVGGKIVGGLGSALSWLAMNPMVAIAGAIAMVVGAIAIFNQSQKEATYELEDCSQAVQDQVNRINELSSSMDDAKNSAEDRMVSSEAEIKLLENNIDALQRMGGESGYVDNIASAQALVDMINQKLPETVKLTEDGRLEWQKTPEEIQRTIDKLVEKSKVEAYSQLYTEELKKQIQFEREHAKAVQDRNSKEAERVDIKKKIADYQNIIDQSDNPKIIGDYSAKIADLSEQEEQLNTDILALDDTIKKSKDGYTDATKSTSDLKNGMYGISGASKDLAESLSFLKDTQINDLDKLSSNYNDSLKQLRDYTEGTSSLTEAEASDLKKKNDDIIAGYVSRAVSYGMSYGQIISLLESKGVEFSEEEKRQWQESYNNSMAGLSEQEIQFETSKNRVLNILKQNDADMTTEQQNQYATLLGLLNEHGIAIEAEKSFQYQAMLLAMDEHGIALGTKQADQYASLLSGLQNHGIDMSNEQNLQHLARLISLAAQGDEEGKKYLKMLQDGVASGDIDDEVWKILKDAGYIFDTNPQTVGINIEDPFSKAQNAFERIQSVFSNPIKAKLDLLMKAKNGVSPSEFATGGFPDVGQLFIANEAGPELIGNLGGRTAVANNYQIEEGIARAVARGSVGNSGSSTPQVINTHITVDLDGEVVAEAVHKSESKKGFNFTKGGGKL